MCCGLWLERDHGKPAKELFKDPAFVEPLRGGSRAGTEIGDHVIESGADRDRRRNQLKPGDALFVPLRAELRRQITSWSRARIDVVPAALGRRQRTLWGARPDEGIHMSFVQEYKSDLIKAIDAIDLAKVNQIIEIFKRARAEGRHIFTCGNGGRRVKRLALRLRHRERRKLQARSKVQDHVA